jgi:hypothetical protein
MTMMSSTVSHLVSDYAPMRNLVLTYAEQL